MTSCKTLIVATAVCLAAVALLIGTSGSKEPVAEPLHTPATVDLQPTTGGAPAEPAPEPPYTPAEAEMLARLIYAEARGVPSDAEKAAVVWCVLNRVDSSRWADTIEGVVTDPCQFAYHSANPVTEGLLALAEDVLTRWGQEKDGQEDVGRVLPADYYFFGGDGKRNHFRKEYLDTVRWDWSLPDPYEN